MSNTHLKECDKLRGLLLKIMYLLLNVNDF